MSEIGVDGSVRWAPHKATGLGWVLPSVIGLALAVACQTAQSQAMYRIKPLGFLDGCTSSVPTVAGLNGKDEVAGTACNAHGDMHAFLWRNNGGPMIDLGPDGIGSYSYARAINASGLVAGDMADHPDGLGDQFAFESSGDGTPARRIPNNTDTLPIRTVAMNNQGQLTGSFGNSGTTAWLWTPDGTPDGTLIRDMGNLGGENSTGRSINDAGQVAGYSDSDTLGAPRAIVWKNGGTTLQQLGDLGSGYSDAFFISGSGQVAGVSSLSGNTRTHAFFWRNNGTPMHDLGTLGGANSTPNALNDSGQIAGFANKKSGVTHAFVWLNDGTAMKDLGTLGGNSSSAEDINFSGQVTGSATLSGNTVTHAFLWRNDGTKIQDLNSLIDPKDPLKSHITLNSGIFINDSGDILAYGTDSRTGVKDLPYLLQGTVLTLSPRSLAFGNRPIHTTSAAKSVTVTNTSAKVVAISSIALKGSAPGQFASTNNCSSSLVGHATCTIKVTFKPTTKGAKTAVLEVNGGGGGLRSVKLTGTGI